ncbi:Carboxylesterase 3 [Camelus dromedarius]|uniref:Carboxylic ester hydrolase n=1 Tax=Camelus dromedarius TaxID=9838 RepID=A0A5N4DQ56_CAMDR|nr:Carboxylesterase 3 [Camelus dromedarius]
MEAAVRTGSRVLVWVACLLLPFSATAAGKTPLQGLQRWELLGPGITQPEVDTTLGSVRSRQVGVKGTDRLMNVFLGIPFAQPPLGPSQFSAPRPAPSWEGVRDASTVPAIHRCLQDVERMNNSRFTLDGKHQLFPISEDCLILNIYSPAEATSGAGRPVMAWIHGGSFVVGAATSHDGSALAAYGDMVVVTVQYRLGIPGFFSTGDKHAPGNWGFLDVVAALRWVQGNITPFGGDFNSVTIFGGSAGACIVSALVLSPLAAGLFHRAIAQSGIITLPGFLSSDPWPLAQVCISFTLLPHFPPMDASPLYGRQGAGRWAMMDERERQDTLVCPQSFASSLACGSNSLAEMLQCLRQKSSKELMLAEKLGTAFYTIDSTFFPKTPNELLRERQLHSVPFLLGVNDHKFGWLIPKGWGILDKMNQMNPEDLLAILRPFLTSMVVIIIVITDIDSIFFYLFQHRPSSFVKFKPAWVRADHGAEMAFLFGGPFLTDESSMLAFPEATEEEKQLSLTMMAQWTHFARTGNPNDSGLPLWPSFNHSEQYLEIGLVPRVSQKLRKARMQFWAETLPTKIQQWQQKMKVRKAREDL